MNLSINWVDIMQGSIYVHLLCTGNKIGPLNSKILTSEDSNIKRGVKEVIYIKQLRPSLNRDEGLEIPTVYLVIS